MFVAHRTRKDFSFLRAILMWGGVLALRRDRRRR